MLKKKILFFIIIIDLIFFGKLINLEFATDTYDVFNFNNKQIFWQYASAGRFVTAIIGYLVKIINLKEYTIYLGSYILAMVCLILSQYKLYKITNMLVLEKNRDDLYSKILVDLVSIIIILNPFLIELFLFVEKGIMIFAILMCIYAIEKFIKYLEYKDVKYLIYSMIFIFIGVCSYQGVVGIFIAISSICVLKYSKNIKEFIINNIIMFLVYGIPTGINYLIVKFCYSNTRIDGNIQITGSIVKILKNTKEMMVSTYNIMPKYSVFLLILFTFGILCYKIIKNKKEVRKILEYIYIILITIFISILPQIFQATESIWFVPRSTYPFGTIYGILILYLICNIDLKKVTKKILIIIMLVFLCFELQIFWKIENDRYILNNYDYEISMRIANKVKKYEKETGNKISKIEIYQDLSPSYTYDNIFVTKDLNIKAYATDWSTKGILEYYLKRNLEKLKSEENIEKFQNKNWNEFNEEQIILKNDVLILCRY